MKVIVIGASGIIGQAVVNELRDRHDVITAGRTGADIKVDMLNIDSIQQMYQQVKNIDAVVLTTGSVKFKSLEEMNDESYRFGLNNKLMGQINVVLSGLQHLNNGGSFTLTSGILNRDPISLGTSAGMVNGALDGFVKCAAIEMPRGIRINIVSPTLIKEALGKYATYFRGFVPVEVAQAALAYSKSVEGMQTGQVYHAG